MLADIAGSERNNAIVPDHPKVFVVTLLLSGFLMVQDIAVN